MNGDLTTEVRTELGNAYRFVARHGGDLRYCKTRRKWLVWDDARWKLDHFHR
jgi:hypothetical protein